MSQQTLGRLEEFNAVLEETTRSHNGQVVHLYRTLNGPDGARNPLEYLQSDACHLNSDGHRTVADLLRDLGYEGGSP